MTPDLERLKALALAATPGPWERVAGYGVVSNQMLDVKDHGHYATWSGGTKTVTVAECSKGHLPGRDADFIAAANPAVILELIARLEHAPVLNVSGLSAAEIERLLRDYKVDPNDPLDDVLPLAPRADFDPLPITLPADLDLPDTEGGSHD